MLLYLIGKMNWKRRKVSYLFLLLTLSLSVAALTIALLIVKSQKMADADEVLNCYGNYDIAFSEATKEVASTVEQDKRLSELGYVYDLGTVTFTDSGNVLEVGALRDKKTEEMYYINPVKGRYPEKDGEICIDETALKSSGYLDEIGQKIKMTCVSSDGTYKEEKEYTLVGIIEVQKQDEGVTYCSRYYPEKMYSTDNVKNINYPYAYISMAEAKKNYSFEKEHILANVSKKEDSAKVFESYIEDEDLVEQLHISTDHIFGREWTADYIIGKTLDNGSASDILENAVKTGSVNEDAYTAYFIPIFMMLIGLITSVGIFDAVRMSTEERRKNYGTLLGMGMTGKRIIVCIVFEFIILFVIGIAVGWGIGILGYGQILYLIKRILKVSLPSALHINSYFLPYINMVTKNPFLWSGVTLFIVCCVGVSSAVYDLLHMSPVGMMNSNIHKKKRSYDSYNLYHILNKYVGRESAVNHVIPYITIAIIMSVSVFGFLFFYEKSVSDTSAMSDRIHEASINGMDYYMKQTEDLSSGAEQYMHESGVSVDDFNELANNSLVEKAKGAMVEHSTALLYDKSEYISNVLNLQSEYTEPISNQVMDQIASKANTEYFEYLGIDTAQTAVINVPSVAVSGDDIMQFEEDVIAGEIHPNKLKNGEEVIVVVTDQTLATYFEVGKSIPLYDMVRPDDIDNSEEWLQGQLPEAYKDAKPAYSVTIDNVTKDYWCFDSLVKTKTKIGAVVYLEPTEENSFYFDAGDGNYTVNILTVDDAYTAWKLPNKNYNRVGITLKNVSDSEKFESTWLKTVQNARYMDSIDAYSIVQEKETKENQVMSIFYSIIAILVIISMVCVGNSIATRIRHMYEEQNTLQLLGMARSRFLILYIRRYATMAIMGAVVSMFPVAVYSRAVKIAKERLMAEYNNNTSAVVIGSGKWYDKLPLYNLINKYFIPIVLVVFIITFILIIYLVLLQYKAISGSLIDKDEKE